MYEMYAASASVLLRVALSAGDPEELSAALEAAIRATLPGAAPISVDTADGEHVVHVGVPSVHVLAGLRGAVLSGEFDATLSQALNQALTLSTAEPAVGDAVTLRGLVKRPALNGSAGEVLSVGEAGGRCLVRLADGSRHQMRDRHSLGDGWRIPVSPSLTRHTLHSEAPAPAACATPGRLSANLSQ